MPNFEEVCADQEDTSCLAWRAGEEILAQAPTPPRCSRDRQDRQRRHRAPGDLHPGRVVDLVPRVIRAFDWSASDAPADEYDLWDGFGLSYTVGDLDVR